MRNGQDQSVQLFDFGLRGRTLFRTGAGDPSFDFPAESASLRARALRAVFSPSIEHVGHMDRRRNAR